MSQFIHVERKGAIAIVSIRRGEKRNALTRAMMHELTRIAQEFQDDREIACVVLTGSPTEFSGGVDLGELAQIATTVRDLEERRRGSELGARMCRAWEEMPQITIAAIEGLNVGGGVVITLSCDWRVMSESAYLYVPEVQIGIPLVWQAMPRLVNMVGLSRAKQVLLLAEKIPAAQALDWGLADFVVPQGDALSRAVALAERVVSMPKLAVRVTKQSANAYANTLNHVASYMDVDQSVLFGMSDAAAQARARFQR
jgi:enoyl-CoA hydratase